MTTMINLHFRVEGWEQADAFFAKLEAALGDLRDPLRNVRDEVQIEIDDLFKRNHGYARAGGGHEWAPWKLFTLEKRTGGFAGAVFGSGGYYQKHASIGENKVGVWTGDMREWFKGEQAPGYFKFTNDSLEMGVSASGAGMVSHEHIRAGVFPRGRPKQWRTAAQEPRPIYENLSLESDSAEWNPIARGFRTWFKEAFGMTDSFV